MTAAKKIVFQGEPGANSHLASRDAYPDYEPVPCATFEDAFAAINSGEAELGMIPIENSIAGRVADIHHLMPESGLHIVAEHFMPVRHQLLAVKGAALDGIRTVESHVHALGQCRKMIRKLRIKPVVAADTAGSAREITQAGDKSRAAKRAGAFVAGPPPPWGAKGPARGGNRAGGDHGPGLGPGRKKDPQVAHKAGGRRRPRRPRPRDHAGRRKEPRRHRHPPRRRN